MTNVTVEGSLTPSVHLARGERRTYVLTPSVQAMIDKGFYTVIETWEPNETPAKVSETDAAVDDGSPARNASAAVWREFLASQDPPIRVHDDATRAEMLDLWDAHQGEE